MWTWISLLYARQLSVIISRFSHSPEGTGPLEPKSLQKFDLRMVLESFILFRFDIQLNGSL